MAPRSGRDVDVETRVVLAIKLAGHPGRGVIGAALTAAAFVLIETATTILAVDSADQRRWGDSRNAGGDRDDLLDRIHGSRSGVSQEPEAPPAGASVAGAAPGPESARAGITSGLRPDPCSTAVRSSASTSWRQTVTAQAQASM